MQPNASTAAQKKLAQAHLKRCPLCDTLNARTNDECFVCGWKGTFDSDGFRLEQGLHRMMRQLPDLQPELPKTPLTWWQRLFGRLRRPLDFRV
jgi:hypothetical protein